MVKRKGEMSSFQIDSGWPYQVAHAQRLTTGKTLDVVYDFCKDLSLCPRGHVFVRDGEHIKCWCFADEADAQKFMARFGGEMIAIEDRPRWPGKARVRQGLGLFGRSYRERPS